MVNKSLKVFQLALMIIGYILLFSVDWKIALGLFLVHWSINFDIN